MSADVIQMPSAVPEWELSDRLRRVRRNLAMKQPEFAERLGYSASTYSAWESGRNVPENIVDVAERLQYVTGVPRAWFLGWMDNAPTPTPEGGERARQDSNLRPRDYKGEGSVCVFPTRILRRVDEGEQTEEKAA